MRSVPLLTSLSLAALLALAPAPAQAKKGLDPLTVVEGVTLSGQVEVPLYTAPTGAPIPCVRVAIGEKTFTFALDLTGDIYVGDGVVAALGLEPKEVKDGKDTKVKVVELESMGIGGLALQGVTARVGGPSTRHDAPAYTTSAGDAMVDGWIGLGFVPAAWALLPSEGVVRFAPLADGPALLQSLGGKVVPYRTTPAREEKYGKQKINRKATGPIIPVEIAGLRLEGIPTFTQWSNSIRTDVELLPDSTQVTRSGNRYVWGDTVLAGQTTGAWAYLDGALTIANAPQMINDYTDAVIGARVLAGFDIAADPSGQGLSFRPIPVPADGARFRFIRARAGENAEPAPTSLDLAIADVRAQIEEAKAAPPPASDEDEKKKDEAPPPPPSNDPPGSPDLYKRLAELLSLKGDGAGMLDAYTTMMAFEDSTHSCTSYLTVGQAYLTTNKIAEAHAAFEKSSALYHAWWDLPLGERETLQEDRAELEPEEAKNAEPRTQPGACFVADDYLAATAILRGDLDEVDRLYRERMDLSPGLAVVKGNAAFLRGDLQAAQAAYRQALQREAAPAALHRVGMAVYFQNAGDWGSARTQYATAMELDPYDVMTALMWADAAARATSPEAALRPIEAFLKANPDSAAAYVAYMRAAQAVGDSAKIADAQKKGKEFFTRSSMLFSSPAFAGARAVFLVESGDLAGARALAEEVLLVDADNALSWLALGNVYVRQGDVDRGENLLRRAGQQDPMHPGFALLINAKIARPAPVE